MAAPHTRWQHRGERKWRPGRAEVASRKGGNSGGSGSADQNGGEKSVRPGTGGGAAAGPGPGDTAAAAEPAAGGPGERQLRRRPAGRAAPARQTPPTLRRHCRNREEEEEDAWGPLQAALPEELPGAAGGAEPERSRSPQLRLGVRGPLAPAPAPLLRRLRLPLGLHLRHLRRPLLLQPLPGHPPGHPVPEVDGVTGTLPPPWGQ